MMIEAEKIFKKPISQMQHNMIMYDHFTNILHIPSTDVSDLLRYQLIYAVSAFDKLVHDLIIVGVQEIVVGKRKPTCKFLSHPFKASTFLSYISDRDKHSTFSPDETAEFLIRNEMMQKLSTLSFQAPDKLKDGLSYIWDESHKMQLIADDMIQSNSSKGEKEIILKQRLQLIIDRRNQIVHEGDINPMTNEKREITKEMTVETVEFIEKLGVSISKFVIDNSCYVS